MSYFRLASALTDQQKQQRGRNMSFEVFLWPNWPVNHFWPISNFRLFEKKKKKIDFWKKKKKDQKIENFFSKNRKFELSQKGLLAILSHWKASKSQISCCLVIGPYKPGKSTVFPTCVCGGVDFNLRSMLVTWARTQFPIVAHF